MVLDSITRSFCCFPPGDQLRKEVPQVIGAQVATLIEEADVLEGATMVH